MNVRSNDYVATENMQHSINSSLSATIINKQEVLRVTLASLTANAGTYPSNFGATGFNLSISGNNQIVASAANSIYVFAVHLNASGLIASIAWKSDTTLLGGVESIATGSDYSIAISPNTTDCYLFKTAVSGALNLGVTAEAGANVAGYIRFFRI